jgi:hypothetical protein
VCAEPNTAGSGGSFYHVIVLLCGSGWGFKDRPSTWSDAEFPSPSAVSSASWYLQMRSNAEDRAGFEQISPWLTRHS